MTDTNVRDIGLVPVPKNEHIKFEDILEVRPSKWYAYTLVCGHVVYSRVRIRTPENYSYMEHYILCKAAKHEPLQWQAIKSMEAATDDQMRDVSSGSAYVLPRSILRVDGHYSVRYARAVEEGDVERLEVIRAHNSGNPFPYSSKDREY